MFILRKDPSEVEGEELRVSEQKWAAPLGGAFTEYKTDWFRLKSSQEEGKTMRNHTHTY